MQAKIILLLEMVKSNGAAKKRGRPCEGVERIRKKLHHHNHQALRPAARRRLADSPEPLITGGETDLSRIGGVRFHYPFRRTCHPHRQAAWRWISRPSSSHSSQMARRRLISLSVAIVSPPRRCSSWVTTGSDLIATVGFPCHSGATL